MSENIYLTHEEAYAALEAHVIGCATCTTAKEAWDRTYGATHAKAKEEGRHEVLSRFPDPAYCPEAEHILRQARVLHQEHVDRVMDQMYTALGRADEVKCPRCRSTVVSGHKKGFGLGKALTGGALLGPVGLLAGLAGSSRVVVTCLNCGHSWKPATR